MVSLEFPTILLGILFGLVWHQPLQVIASDISSTEEIVKHIALLPSLFFGWDCIEARKLLFPEEDKRGALQAWDDYWRYKIHYHVALFYGALFALCGFTIWAFGLLPSTPTGLAFSAMANIGALTVSVSIFLARDTVREMLIRAKDNPNACC